jgi:SAM-dependent methyltransferase
MAYVEHVVHTHGIAGKSTLEVGSLDVNGSVRSLFTGLYHGLDMRDGPGVDEVANAENLARHDSRWEVVVCTETLEHVRRPWIAVKQMADALGYGGFLILTARGYDQRGAFPVHGFPEDYWRFSREGFAMMVRDAGLDVTECVLDPETPGVFCLGRS